MQKYKIKLKPGDYIFINNLNPDEFHKVAQRFLADGCKEVESVKTSHFNFFYFGWRPNHGTFFSSSINVYLDHYSCGTHYQYEEIMELAEPEESTDWHPDSGEIPPVGTIVEYCGYDGTRENRNYDTWRNGDLLEVLAIKQVGSNKVAIVFNLRDETASGMDEKYFLPVKSDRQKAIEKALEYLPLVDKVGDFTTDFLGNLYDVGLLRLPEAE